MAKTSGVWNDDASYQYGDDYEFDATMGKEKMPNNASSFTSGEEVDEDDYRNSEAENPSPHVIPIFDSRSRWSSDIVSGLGRPQDEMSPALERRVRDFKFAQQKRTEKYGSDRPWGILGLYDHLTSIRIDLEWAEDAAWRRAHHEPYLSWQDFEKLRRKGTNRPFFTYFLILFCSCMMIVSIGLNGWKVEPFSINPMIGPSGLTLLRLGAKESSLIVNKGEWYRLFSPMVLHAGFIHYFLNMAALWFVGSAIEKSHGIVNAAIAFFLAAVGGNILSALFLPQYISVGASGGIFGFIGMCVSDICLNWSLIFMKDGLDEGNSRFRHGMVVLWLILDIVINCVIGLTPFIDNFTHLGGLMYGFLCGLSTIDRLKASFFGVSNTTLTMIRNNLISFSGLILSIVLILTTTVLLIQSDGETSPCSSCRYISCVPFPPWSESKFGILSFILLVKKSSLSVRLSHVDKFWYCDDCDQVTADARKNDPMSLFFDEMDLTCPDGTLETVDISSQRLEESSEIRSNLANYCRQYCDDIFK
jgi:membrane associated rhomboid family serine protease